MPMHSHQCQNCATIWQHDDSCRGDEEAHKCPRCGKIEWYQYIPGLSQSCQAFVNAFRSLFG